ncbi:MAG: lactonase family protein [Streptococcaceae bacterium]|jgi:6-phosphogluconolactonase|nr:lactonase family protein [Streptococcaceae bacterium]
MKEKVLFSGYTKREAKGVYSAMFDNETGMFSDLELVCTVDNPTYLDLDKNGHLYTVAADENGGGIAGFNFDGSKGEVINYVTSEGAPLCYIAVDEARDLVYGPNYHLGQIRVYKRAKDGSLTLADQVTHEGSGPHPNQTIPHVHYSNLTPDNRLVACDLGTDGVYTYDVSDEGKLTLVDTYFATPGAGSRHLTFHPNGKIAYLMAELNSTVEVLSYDAATGKFALIETITTLPDTHEGFNGTAAIRLSKDAKHLYASNRGHDSLVVYNVSVDGTHLEISEWVSVEGKTPRDFNFSKDEKFVIVANQDSDNVTTFKRDEENGKLTLVQKDFYVPEATCVYPL